MYVPCCWNKHILSVAEVQDIINLEYNSVKCDLNSKLIHSAAECSSGICHLYALFSKLLS